MLFTMPHACAHWPQHRQCNVLPHKAQETNVCVEHLFRRIMQLAHNHRASSCSALPSDALSLVCTHLAMLARPFTSKSIGTLDDPEYVQSAVTAQNGVGVMPTRPHSRDILSERARKLQSSTVQVRSGCHGHGCRRNVAPRPCASAIVALNAVLLRKPCTAARGGAWLMAALQLNCR